MNAGRSRLSVGCLLVVLLALAASGGVSLLADPVDAQSGSVFVQQDAIAADEIRISIELREDGSAAWSLGFWRVLDDDDSRTAFDSLQRDIESDPQNYTAEFATRMETTADAASNATGREMAVGNVTVGTEQQSLAREYGVIRYSFEWEGFARTDGEELYAGDAIERLYLGDGTRLLISWPEGYDLQEVAPDPDNRRETAVLWQGSDTEFIATEPRVVVAPSGLGLGAIAGLLAGFALLTGVAGWILRRRSADGFPGAETDGPPETPPVSADSEANTPQTDPDAEPESVEEDTRSDAQPDPSLLSNEEQVMQLLEANGGRMKQQTIVEELGWTDAKTSKVVSGMREAGTIESFRIGRENVLTTPDADPREPGP
ncbi:helix-turn-helix transcriptional regulator [Halohasta litorea]|uniref:Helix-turn-helix transcriptional regulator n=1 Tax=Halohasta litorea TaxID=869891 RepID=A0ABD6D5G3_9EURY|nr:hypothetical protein [Halohasta litorea]